MLQSQPSQQILRHRENVSQHVDLKLIKGFVDICLEQRLKQVQSIFNFQLRFRIDNVSFLVGVGNRRTVGRSMSETESLGRR